MHSGVGPAEQLKAHGILVEHDLSGVGSRLVDHPVVDLYFKDKLGLSVKYMKPKTLGDVFRYLAAIFQYMWFRRGVLATNVSLAWRVQEHSRLLSFSSENQLRSVGRTIRFCCLQASIRRN
jgi:choline dehydrogenase-like flavoprotein